MFDNDKKIFIYMIDFMYQIEILLLNKLKLLKILGFFSDLVKNSRFTGFWQPCYYSNTFSKKKLVVHYL